MTNKELSDIRRKKKVLEYAKKNGNISKTCRHFGIPRDTYYRWKKIYETSGDIGLINKKPCPENPKLRTPQRIEEKILYLRRTYHLGQKRIMWYLKRYHDISVSEGAIYNVLKRNQLNKLPQNQRKRSSKAFKRYEKKVPGHPIQIDVKFLKFVDKKTGKKIKRFQYTAIDDATRARCLKIYNRHTQANAILFVNYVIERFPFRIHTIQTDNGYEFQIKFHWHCEDLGIRHVYIKPASLHLNGKVERSHLTDKTEFHQLIDYINDIDIRKKLEEWEIFYNCHRPHGSLNGQTPLDLLRKN